jgi:hypothetical protein
MAGPAAKIASWTAGTIFVCCRARAPDRRLSAREEPEEQFGKLEFSTGSRCVPGREAANLPAILLWLDFMIHSFCGHDLSCYSKCINCYVFQGIARYLDAQSVLVRAVFVAKIPPYLTRETQGSPPLA